MSKLEELIGDDPNAEAAPEPEAPKKRGRKPGSTNGPRYGGPKKGFDVDGLAANLRGIHELVALVVGPPVGPIIQITEKEAKAFAVALSNLVAQYEIIVDPKTLAWINLLSVMASIYAPRFFMLRMAMAQAQAAAQADLWAQQGTGATVDGSAERVQ